MNLKTKNKSADGATKYLFEVERNHHRYYIESAFLYLPYRKIKSVVCLSTQIGCSQKCSFCTSAALPFVSNLSSQEIKEQMDMVTADNLHLVDDSIEYAFEGTGEPLLNYETVVETINQYENGAKQVNFVISTAGIVPKICQLASENFCHPTRLQISLHFPTDEQRREFMPGAKYSIEEIIRSAKEFAVKQKQKVALNYLLIENQNDFEEDIFNLAKLVDKEWFYVKLSHLNGDLPYHSPPRDKFERIKNALMNRGIKTKIFAGIGKQISAGCGQLTYSYSSRGG